MTIIGMEFDANNLASTVDEEHRFDSADDAEFLTEKIGILSREQYYEMLDQGVLWDWITEHYWEIFNEHRSWLLGRVDGTWYWVVV